MSEEQRELPGVRNDPGNYRELSRPFASLKEAEAATAGFWDEFYALRNKYKITDVVVVMRFSVASDGDESSVLLTMQAGDALKEESMLAYAFGDCQARRQENIGRLLHQSVTRKEARK